MEVLVYYTNMNTVFPNYQVQGILVTQGTIFENLLSKQLT